ncbi:alpha/beta fold hydrolase [Microbacterium sp. CIAB417]|uniref:alpha/beta fold hydrolase n=1 Tax=Microbacterium sp. CIAB417 TaxID=2860287 RepID=UPI001FABB069|nr:alpha/beta hydrolase [Microbacterium sp. CIAB417]
MSNTPTVVLLHGAFTDGASWSPVVLYLQGAGVTVRVPALTNRSLAEDAAYVRAFVERIPGDVLLVGHSYGAAVAGVAGGARNVRGIMFVSGYALDEGESLSDVHARFPDAEAVPFFERVTYVDVAGSDREEISVAADEFPFVTALGVPADEAGVLAVIQRPLTTAALTEPAPSAAWRTTPTWGIVSASDRTLNPDAVRWTLARANVRWVVELPGPHLLMHTHPAEIARAIQDAAAEIG